MEEENVKKANKKFIIKFSIFCLLLILVTTLVIYLTILFLNKGIVESDGANREIQVEETKKEAEDKKFAIEKYSETYNKNSLKTTTYYDVDGKIMTEYQLVDNAEREVQFIQIYGLKNSNVQNKINKILKEKAYSLKGEYVYSTVTANFSNILSVSLYSDARKNIGLNFDLTTGEIIPLEKVFVSSATLNSYLANGLYKRLAWNTLSFDEESFEEMNDMDKVDTSEYEDKFIKLVNNYNKQKGNVQYNIYPSRILVYGLVDDEIIKEDYEVVIEIELSEIPEEVAIYKRYLTNESIFEDDSIGRKGLIVFTDYWENEQYMKVISYGKISDNIFVEETLYKYMENDEKDKEVNDKITEFAIKISKEEQEKLKNQTSVNQGLFFQREYGISHYEEKHYYTLSMYTHRTKCSVYYFQEEAFKDFVNLKNRPTASAEGMFFNEYMKTDYPNLSIGTTEEKTYYFNEDGEFLSDNEEDALEKIRKETEDEEQNTIVNNEQENTEVNNSVENNIVKNTIVNNTTANNTTENNTVNQNTTKNNANTNENTEEHIVIENEIL